jgi:tetratricopeptide (TPR) repeat protein
MQLALKVMLNYQTADNTLALNHEFDAETALLSDPARLPPHRHVMAVLHSFADDATPLPGWDFDPSLVMSRTMMVVMPYFPQDLKAVFRSARRHGQDFGNGRTARIIYHLLLAVHHLKSHDIVHRDIKLDNVLLANIGTDEESAVLTDFGMCFDMRKNQVHNWKVEMKFDGFRRGGAPIALAPEVTLPKPGPDAFLDYSRNDEWATGMVAHELFSKGDHGPFADMEHPATYSEAGYIDEGIAEHCKPLVRSMLRMAVADRISAAEGSRKARQLLNLCMLKETLASTSLEYQTGALTKIDAVLERCDRTPGAAQEFVDAKQSLEACRDRYVATAKSSLQIAASDFSIRIVQSELQKFAADKPFVLEAWVTLDQHRVVLEMKMKRQLESAADAGEEGKLEAALASAADFGDAVLEARQTALAALSQARARTAAEAAVARGEELLASDKFNQAIEAFKEAAETAKNSGDGPLQAHIVDRLKDAEKKAKAIKSKRRDQAPPVTAEALGRALSDAISVGVPLWNSGNYAGCAAEYLRVVSQFQHADINLARAVRDCDGQSTGSARDSQGWILRRAMDECLQKIRAGTWQAVSTAPKVVLLCSDFADHRADVQKHLARGLGLATVPMIDLHESTPSSVTLAQYNVALVFTATWGAGMMRGFPSTSYDRSAVGDRLADFVDSGGSVVMM